MGTIYHTNIKYKKGCGSINIRKIDFKAKYY